MKHIQLLAVLFFALALGLGAYLPCAAAGAAAVLQAYTRQDTAHFFLSGAEGGEITCSIGHTDCTVLGQGSLEEEEIPIYTAFLIDVSTSIQPQSQYAAIVLLTDLVDQKPEKDQFALFTFGQELRNLIGFDADRWELIKAIEQLQYADQSTSLYDAVLELTQVLPDYVEEDGPVFLQLVVLSDGVDQTEGGILKEELFYHLQQNPYPVHTVGFPYGNNSQGLNELYAVSRISGANSYDLGDETDSSTLVADLADYVAGVTWIQAQLPPETTDGATRPVVLQWGGGQLIHDMKMPYLRGEPGDGEPAEEEPSPVEEPVVAQPQVLPAEEAGAFPTWIVMGGAGLLLVAAIAAAVLRKTAAGKGTPQHPQLVETLQEDPPASTSLDSLSTQYLSGGEKHTEFLLPPEKQMEGRSIALMDIAQAGKRFTCSMGGDVVVGRRPGNDVVVDYSKKVSGKHCRIYSSGGSVMVEDLGSTNGTFVNDQRVSSPTPLSSQDVLRLGDVKLLVTIQGQ